MGMASFQRVRVCRSPGRRCRGGRGRPCPDCRSSRRLIARPVAHHAQADLAVLERGVGVRGSGSHGDGEHGEHGRDHSLHAAPTLSGRWSVTARQGRSPALGPAEERSSAGRAASPSRSHPEGESHRLRTHQGRSRHRPDPGVQLRSDRRQLVLPLRRPLPRQREQAGQQHRHIDRQHEQHPLPCAEMPFVQMQSETGENMAQSVNNSKRHTGRPHPRRWPPAVAVPAPVSPFCASAGG
jgi:hypothetical protein